VRRRWYTAGPSPAAGPRRPETGSGVVLVLGLAAVTIGLGVVLTALGAAAVARHRAESAADLAALAAAAGWPAPDCGRAQPVAAAAGARVLDCRTLPDGSVLVETTCRLPGGLDRWAGTHRPIGRARAGRAAEPP
jgi:secretion/DNA translocation related TadE-like protein